MLEHTHIYQELSVQMWGLKYRVRIVCSQCTVYIVGIMLKMFCFIKSEDAGGVAHTHAMKPFALYNVRKQRFYLSV